MASEPSRSSPFWGPDATSFQWQIDEKWGEGVGRWRRKLFTYYIINTWIYDHQQSSKTLWVLHQDRTSRKRSRDGETYDRLPSCSFFCSSWSASSRSLYASSYDRQTVLLLTTFLLFTARFLPAWPRHCCPVRSGAILHCFLLNRLHQLSRTVAVFPKKSNITRTYLHLPKSIGSHFNCQFSLHIYISLVFWKFN